MSEFPEPSPARKAELERIHQDWLAGRDAADPYASEEAAVGVWEPKQGG